MHTYSRRHFIKLSSLSFAAIAVNKDCRQKTSTLPLAFSTLGCPDWNFDKIVEFAQANGYTGIEVRGILHEMDLPKCPEFSNDANIANTMSKMRDHGLQFVDLGSSSTMHFPQGAERMKQIEDGKRFIDLAAKVSCPNVRVFPNKFIDGQSKEDSMSLIAEGLHKLGEHAKGGGVNVLMETHGDMVHPEDIVTVMQKADHPNAGLVYDIANMWVITKQPPSEVYPKIRQWVKHTHIKDAKVEGDKIDYALLGKGDVPIFEGITLLMKDNYPGYYSFEWEKLWHPEIAEPEVALTDFPLAIKTFIDKS